MSETNNLLEKLKEDYNNLKRSKINSKSLDDFINQLSNEEGNEKRIEDFEYKFREMYPEFYTKLSNAIEDLTKTELRICAF